MTTKHPRANEQLELMAPRHKRPAWHALPTDTRQRVIRLIAQLLREAHAKGARGQNSEGNHE